MPFFAPTMRRSPVLQAFIAEMETEHAASRRGSATSSRLGRSEVLQRMSRGLASAAIGEGLVIAESTVKFTCATSSRS